MGNSNNSNKPAEKPAAKPAAKDAQKVRDAHYFENGVKEDGTGGKAPKEK